MKKEKLKESGTEPTLIKDLMLKTEFRVKRCTSWIGTYAVTAV